MKYPVRNVKSTFKGAGKDCYMGVRGFTCDDLTKNEKKQGLTFSVKKIIPEDLWHGLLTKEVHHNDDPWDGL